MNIFVSTETLTLPEVSVKEVLRYARAKENDKTSLSLLKECIEEARVENGKIAYCNLPVKIEQDTLDLGPIHLESKNLGKFLKDTDSVVLFAATIGISFDRLITKYSLLSPAKALMLQALGAERAEALCDAFSDFIKEKVGAKKALRFSPGYGDVPLSLQKEIIKLLCAEKNCGIYVNDSFLLSPSKTVTAFLKTTNIED